MERVQAMELDMRTLAAEQSDLETAFHTAQDDRTMALPTTLEVPNAASTVGSTFSDPLYRALMTRLDAIEAQTANQNNGTSRRPKAPRQFKYYCYSHGINLTHDSKDCRNKRAGHDKHPGATRCDPCGGSTRNIDRWMKWTGANGDSN